MSSIRNPDLTALLPVRQTLRDPGTACVILQITPVGVNQTEWAAGMADSIEALLERERLRGTFRLPQPLHGTDFRQYFLSDAAFCAVDSVDRRRLLGAFSVRPLFTDGYHPDKCQVSILVAEGERGRGVGRAIGLAHDKIAPALGYRSTVNYVEEDNVLSLRLHRSLGYERIGRLPDTALQQDAVGSIMLYKRH